MPLIHRVVTPVELSCNKLELKGKKDSEYIAVNNGTLVNVLRQLASLVNHATDIFAETATLTEQVGKRVRSIKLRLDELEAKAELFDPKLVPVPEGSLDDVSISTRFSREVVLDSAFFLKVSRPRFLKQLFENAGSHQPNFPPRSPIATLTRKSVERLTSIDNRRPASFAALRDWKLDDYLDEKIATLDKKKQSAEELNRALALPFPSQVVQVDVTGNGFDRMKKNRRSLVIHTKRIRNKKRRNTICGSMPNKECGIQTSFSSVNSPTTEDNNKKYGIDSGHWSSCTSSAQGGNGAQSQTSSAPSPWDPTSLSTSSDFLFDDEDRCLTPQLENFTDGLVSDSDSVDTDGYFTSFRSDCGFPKSKKLVVGTTIKEEGKDSSVSNSIQNGNSTTATENEYELFGKGSTSTTASSCGTVVLRSKPNPPARTTSAEHLMDKKSQSQDETEWEERVKRKSLIERVPSLVVVTPSPSCSSESPPPLKDPGFSLDGEDSDKDSGRITPKAEDFLQTTGSECGTLSDTDSELRGDFKLTDLSSRPASTSSSTGTVSSGNSTLTLTSGTVGTTGTTLPQPDVIPDVQQLQIIRTKGTPKLDVSREYFSLDTVLLASSSEEERRQLRNVTGEVKTNNTNTVAAVSSATATLERVQSPQGSATSGKIRGARVVLDANGEIIFASETLRRKRKPKVSFDPGSAVKTLDYDNCGANYSRIRESVYDRIRKDSISTTPKQTEKLYECIEEIRRQNLRNPSYLEDEKPVEEIQVEEENNSSTSPVGDSSSRCSSSSSNRTSSSKTSSLASRYASRPPLSPPKERAKAKVNVLLETDLDSAIPPSMSDLKNLPKIKDRLKRNESYRIANTDDIPPAPATTTTSTRPTLISLSPQINNKISSRRMSFCNSKDSSPNGNLHLNKKRDILEEDPLFIQQILNLSTTSAKSPSANPSYNNRITLSKLALTPEDRPTFLRRENVNDHEPIWIADSPPTMDDIAKEIYRFRKKFNIQPNSTSRNLVPANKKSPPVMDVNLNRNVSFTTSGSSTLPSKSKNPMVFDRNGNLTPYSNHVINSPVGSNRSSPSRTSPPASTIPFGFPKLQVQFSTPLSSSTPVKRSANNNLIRSPMSSSATTTSTLQTYSSLRPSSALSNNSYYKSPPDTTNSLMSNGYGTPGTGCSKYSSSNPPPPPIRNFSSSGRRFFPMKTTGAALQTSDNINSNSNYNYNNPIRSISDNGPLSGYRRNAMSLAETTPGSISLAQRTSLNDFKKLLQASQRKKNSISAMEALKPKIGLETTL